MRKLMFGMNVTLDGYIAATGDDIGWSGPPSDELFQWWLDQERASGLTLYGRKLWETMSSYWPTGDQQPDATPAEIEFARNWRDTPKVVFSSTIDKVDWNTRLVTGACGRFAAGGDLGGAGSSRDNLSRQSRRAPPSSCEQACSFPMSSLVLCAKTGALSAANAAASRRTGGVIVSPAPRSPCGP